LLGAKCAIHHPRLTADLPTGDDKGSIRQWRSFQAIAPGAFRLSPVSRTDRNQVVIVEAPAVKPRRSREIELPSELWQNRHHAAAAPPEPVSYQFRDEMTFHRDSAIRPRRGRAVPFSSFAIGHFKAKTVSFGWNRLQPAPPPNHPILFRHAVKWLGGGAGW
jgi:hypothetical protein